jgi:hypothetical protein
VLRLLLGYCRLPRALRWSLAMVWAMAIWWASSRSRVVLGDGTGWSLAANGAHFVIFGVFAVLILLAAEGAMRVRVTLAVVLSIVYAIVDEIHQSLVPGRDASVWDACADAAGAAWFSAALVWVLRGGRGSRAAMLALAPVGVLFVCLATFG